jgi:hypothetical protein
MDKPTPMNSYQKMLNPGLRKIRKKRKRRKTKKSKMR